MLEKAIQLTRKVLGIEPSIYATETHDILVRSGKRQVIRYFRDFGFPQGKKSAIVRVPDLIFRSGPRIKRGFLRGLFSADGCFFRKKYRGECRLEVTSHALRDGFVILASHFKFNFRKYSYVHKGGHNKSRLYVAYLGSAAPGLALDGQDRLNL
jgi:intein/homing endonuclease